jgi:hypothetical protein
MGLSFVTKGITELKSKLNKLANNVQAEVGKGVGGYVIEKMQEYVPYAHVPFKSAYGGWFSDKQRKYVMAKIREGSIRPGAPSRTQSLRNGWNMVQGDGLTTIKNSVPYAGYVIGDADQSRMHKKIGWWTVSAKLGKIVQGVMDVAKVSVDVAIKRLGL